MACSEDGKVGAGVGYLAVDLGPGRCVAVNDGAVVLGIDASNVPFTVTRDGTRTNLGSISADELTVAVAISDEGAVVGYAEGRTARRAVRRVDGAWQALGDAYGAATFVSGDTIAGVTGDLRGFVSDGDVARELPLPAGLGSAVYGVSAGRAIGIVESASGATHGFLIDGELIDIGTLGGAQSAALALNDKGAVVGAAELASGRTRAFLRDSDGTMTDLGVLEGGTDSDARGIDASGRIVGNVRMADGTSVPSSFAVGKVPTSIMPKDEAGRPFVSAHVAAVSGDGLVAGWGMPSRGTGSHCILWTPGAK